MKNALGIQRILVFLIVAAGVVFCASPAGAIELNKVTNRDVMDYRTARGEYTALKHQVDTYRQFLFSGVTLLALCTAAGGWFLVRLMRASERRHHEHIHHHLDHYHEFHHGAELNHEYDHHVHHSHDPSGAHHHHYHHDETPHRAESRG